MLMQEKPASIHTQEGLSLYFLIRHSNASGKSSTGWLWLAQRHRTVKQDTWYNPCFCSFWLQFLSSRVSGWPHTVLQSAGLASLGRLANTWGLVASYVFSQFLSKQTSYTSSKLQKLVHSTAYSSQAWGPTAHLLLSGKYLDNIKCVLRAASDNQPWPLQLKHNVPSILQSPCRRLEVIFHPLQHTKHPSLALMLNCSHRQNWVICGRE